MPTRILLRLLLLAGLAMPLGALALGVGSLTVRSALNQNFEAEIPLTVNNPAELTGLTVRIPRQADFAQVGIEWLEFLSKLRFAVQTAPGGPSFIKVTSVQPIREPSFNLLLEVVWPRGRLLRTFPVHLDPELYADRQPPPPPLLLLALPTVQAPLIETPSLAAAPVTPSLPPAPSVSFDGASLYGPIKPGETLNRIARQVRPSTAMSVLEMMAILVAGNPQAFANGNPNTLRAGAVLRVPSPQALGQSPTPAPVPDVAAMTPVEPGVSPPTLTSTETSVAPPASSVETLPSPPVSVETLPTPPPAEISPTVAESAPPPMPIEPPKEIIPQATIPRTEPQPAPVNVVEPPPAATGTPPAPALVAAPPPQTAAPVLSQEGGMDWLSNPIVWIAFALILLAIGAVLLLPLLRRPARPKTPATSEEPMSASDAEGEKRATDSETRVAVRRSETRSRRPIPASAEEIAAPAAPAPPPVVESMAKPTPKVVATPLPKPIDELLKDIDFNLGDEQSRMVAGGKSAPPVVRSIEAQRMPDTEPPTASTQTPGSFAPPLPARPISPTPPLSPAKPQSEPPSRLQLDKLEFDLSELGLDAARKPVELPPLELKPAVPSKPADVAAMDFNFPVEPPTQSDPSVESPKPKVADFKFEFADVSQNQTEVREDLARLDEELRSFSDGGLDLSKLALDSPPGSGDAGADYIETKLDLAAAYLDMGDQVGAKGLLDDVLQEGDATQKKRADEMLKKLG